MRPRRRSSGTALRGASGASRGRRSWTSTTYELFVRTVEEAGNEVLLQATRAVQAFAYQLAYPKIFDARHASAVLAPAGIEAPHVLDYYDAVVRWCIATNWGAAA